MEFDRRDRAPLRGSRRFECRTLWLRLTARRILRVTRRFAQIADLLGRLARRADSLVAMSTLALACTNGASSHGAVEPVRRREPPAISLSQIERGHWKVALHTGQATSALRFARNPDDSRARRWQVESGFELVHENGIDTLRRKDGTAFQTASLTVPARYVVLPKEYAPFSPYSDGSTLIYSGQFHFCTGKSPCPSDGRWQINVTVPPGTHLVVEGGVHASHFTFIDGGEGTNIYVGKTTPLNSSHFVAVLDDGLPLEVRAALYRLLPSMMDFFTARLGELSFKPMLFASLDPDPPKDSEFSMQGGGLPGQIFFHLYGEKWARGAEERLLDRLPWVFAHEAGHLFQFLGSSGDAYPQEQSWIHEGGAEAFAALTLVEFGGVSRDDVETRIEDAVSECARGLAALPGKALEFSAKAGAFGNYYTCGLVIQLAIDTEVKRTSGGIRDLFDVWARFLSRVRGGEPWNQDTFLSAADELGAVKASGFARALATMPQDEPLEFLRTGLDEAK
jgi:hypothetical protein